MFSPLGELLLIAQRNDFKSSSSQEKNIVEKKRSSRIGKEESKGVLDTIEDARYCSLIRKYDACYCRIHTYCCPYGFQHKNLP